MTLNRLGQARRTGPILLLGAALAAGVVGATRPADARSSRHSGTGYGVQGGVSPDLALANVFSGIYGPRYTYQRESYDFRGCPDPVEASFGYTPSCPPPARFVPGW